MWHIMCYSLECHDVYEGKRQVQLVFDSNLQNDEFLAILTETAVKVGVMNCYGLFGILKTPK